MPALEQVVTDLKYTICAMIDETISINESLEARVELAYSLRRAMEDRQAAQEDDLQATLLLEECRGRKR